MPDLKGVLRMNTSKCSVKAKAHVSPVEGSVKEDGTGTCPVCLTPGVKLSKGGHIGAHAVAVEVDPTLPVVATGSPKGDPRDATVRRAVDARLIAAGSVPMPVAERDPEGREERASRTAASPGPAMYRGRAMEPMASEVSVCGAQDELPMDMAGTRSSRGVRSIPDPRSADAEPGGDAVLDTRTGFAGLAGTMYGPTGGERMDREASTVPMHGGPFGYLTLAQYEALSRTHQRKYWAKLKRLTDQAKAHRRHAVASLADPVAAEVKRLRELGRV
jgi:hypothetical protein